MLVELYLAALRNVPAGGMLPAFTRYALVVVRR